MPAHLPTHQHPDPGTAPGSGGVGRLLRDWRTHRRCSQLNLALDVGVSPRHLSFIETGRARPSPAMLVALADRLDLPLRERNRLLLAAGYAPRYSERALDDAGLQAVRDALQRLLQAHEPYPGLVLDRHWNVVLANRSASALTALLPAFLTSPTLNIFRASLHPQGLAAWTENFDDWAHYLLQALQRASAGSADAALAALAHEVQGYPNVQALLARQRPRDGRPGASADDSVLVPCVLKLPTGRLAMFTTLTSFGTPRDVTLQELCVELFYPADAPTQRLLHSAAQGQPGRTPAG
jgi:transcriptional regulator with XRE-family HTH domain